MLMDQKIFKMDLSVAAVSAYLAVCGLADGGTPLTLDVLADVWGGSEEELASGICELEKRGILVVSGVEEISVLGADTWQQAV